MADPATAVVAMAIAGPAAVADPAAAITHLWAMATISAMISPQWATAADVRKRLRFRETTVVVGTITRETAAYPTAILPTGRITRKYPAEITVIVITETIAA